MSDSVLRTKALDFSVMIPALVKDLKKRGETITANQLGRSGTSIGANLFEAQYAQGKADFISKLQIALKEASETGYWLELLFRTKAISQEQYKILDSACTDLRLMLIPSVKTLKNSEKTTKN